MEPIQINAKQQAFLKARHKRRTFVGGRGVGKSTVLGYHNALKAIQMPMAKSALAGITYGQIYNKTLPAAELAWKLFGLEEYDPRTKRGQYIVGRRPPEGWLKPHQRPMDYSHTISFMSGYCIEAMSMHKSDSSRGGNYDALDMDESALLKEEDFNKILLPMVRGNRVGPTKIDSYLHQSICDFTSSPWTIEGQWVFKTEELAKQRPERYLFISAKTSDNLYILGQEYIDDLKDSLSDIEYAVEVENYRLGKAPNGFYPSFDTDRHVVLDTYSLTSVDIAASTRMVAEDTYCHRDLPIELSWDFNANFTSCLVAQEISKPSYIEQRFIENLYVRPKPGEVLNLIDRLADIFIDRYQHHGAKTILLHGDRNGNNKNANSSMTFYDQIKQRLSASGWHVIVKVTGLDAPHDLKHHLINRMLDERTSHWPRIRIHGEKCKGLVMSIQNAPITNEYKKDKRSEKKAIDQVFATHLSDCFDALLWRKYNYLITGSAFTGSISFL